MYAEMHMPFHPVYTVLSTYGVRRCNRAAYIVSFAARSNSRAFTSSIPSAFATSSSVFGVCSTFFAGL